MREEVTKRVLYTITPYLIMSSAEIDLINKLRDQEIKTETLQRDLNKVRQQLDDTRLSEAKLLSSQKNELDVSNEQIRELTRVRDDMESKLFAVKGEKTDLEGKLRQMEETLSRQEREMRGMQLELRAKTTDLGDINTREADMKRMSMETENAKRRSAELEGINKELHSELKTCNNTIQDLRSEIKINIDKIEAANRTVASLEDENEQLKEEINDITYSPSQQTNDAMNKQSNSKIKLPTLNFAGRDRMARGSILEEDQATARGEPLGFSSMLSLNRVPDYYTPREDASLAIPLLQVNNDPPMYTGVCSIGVQTIDHTLKLESSERDNDTQFVCPCVIC
eukprot:Tbor_TRINITY_DN5318_c0_g6::TRINITY_DN5318_c0_g6_i1::g.4695::m.4695